MKEVKPIKTWEQIMMAVVIGMGCMLFADTGRIEALLLAAVLATVWYARVWALRKQSAISREE
jgi:hypothetical protein